MANKRTLRSPTDSAVPESDVNLRCLHGEGGGRASCQERVAAYGKCLSDALGTFRMGAWRALEDGAERLRRGRPGRLLLAQAELAERGADGGHDGALERVLRVVGREGVGIGERRVRRLGRVDPANN